MAQVIWSVQARCDLDRVEDYIAMRGAPRTARDFVIALAEKAGGLSRRASAGRGIPEDDSGTYRQLTHGRYRIIYRCFTDQVLIIRVWHQSRILAPRHLKHPRPC